MLSSVVWGSVSPCRTGRFCALRRCILLPFGGASAFLRDVHEDVARPVSHGTLPLDQSVLRKLGEVPLDSGFTDVKRFGELFDGIDHIHAARIVRPAVLPGECRPVKEDGVEQNRRGRQVTVQHFPRNRVIARQRRLPGEWM